MKVYLKGFLFITACLALPYQALAATSFESINCEDSSAFSNGEFVSDDGSVFHQGEVEVYHHFPPADAQALCRRMKELQAEIVRVKGSIDAFFNEARVLEQQYTNVQNQVNAKRNQY